MAAPGSGIRVWDPVIRAGHWTLAGCIAIAWGTRTGGHALHEVFGYGALAIAFGRLIWGFVGPLPTRFSGFVRAPAATLAYARQVIAGNEPRYVGHNPLGGWMIVALLSMVGAVGASGWLSTTETYWGVKWVAELHEALSDLLLALVALHVAGVLLASRRHRENLVAAMLHGRKRAREQGDL